MHLVSMTADLPPSLVDKPPVICQRHDFGVLCLAADEATPQLIWINPLTRVSCTSCRVNLAFHADPRKSVRVSWLHMQAVH